MLEQWVLLDEDAKKEGIKHDPWVQELFQKDFVFFRPSTIGPILHSIIGQYNHTFSVRKTK